ncbi:DUF4880 domain-containing protein [Orrella sp. JC864]|uniref:FecR family protein n=1 Tax=Orrella sp. JC864 TaxID=3120298 RepID=UPI0030080124
MTRTATTASVAQPDEALQAQARAWIRLIRSGRATTDDAKALAHWLGMGPAHELAFEQAKRDWHELGQVLQVHRLARARRAGVLQAGRRRWLLAGGAGVVAAGAAAVGVLPWLGRLPALNEWGADYSTRVGELREFDLAGQVQVALSARSSLSVSTAGPAHTRLALIGGEAAVSARDAAHRIELQAGPGLLVFSSGSVDVRWLGGRACASCIEGFAELRHPLGVRRLAAGQQVAYDTRAVQAVETVGAERLSAWRRGWLVFDEAPLPEVVADLNRYRSGRIVVVGERLAGRRLSGRFSVDDIEQALARIEQLVDAQVRSLPGGVRILS